MSISLRWQLKLAVLAACLASCAPVVYADEAAGNAPMANEPLATPAADAVKPADGAAGDATKAAEGAAPAAATGPNRHLGEVEDGPLFEKRKALLQKILAAKKQGCGIGVYMSEFGKIEDKVKGGEPAENYQERLDQLGTGIDEQLKRSQILKTQRPAVSSGSGSSGSGSPLDSLPLKAGSGGGGGRDAMLDQLKGQIPGGLGNLQNLQGLQGKLTPEMRQKLMQSDMAKELLKKFGGGGQ